MARIRSLRPEFWSDRKMADLSPMARLLYMALWNYCDDEGRGRYLPKAIEGFAFPFEQVDISTLLGELIRSDRITPYEIAGEQYFYIPRFVRYQKPDKASASRLPAPSDVSSKPPRSLPEASESGTPPVIRNLELVVGTEHMSPASQDDGFAAFWNTYPTRNGKKLDKRKAAEAWKRLKTQERETARRAVAHYAEACNTQVTIAKDAFRWLQGRAFDDWQEPATQRGDAVAEAAAAWDEVVLAMQQVGVYRIPEWSSERIRKSVQALGGWRTLCEATPAFMRPRFLAAWRSQA